MTACLLLFLASVLAQPVIHQQFHFHRQGNDLFACPAFVRLADFFLFGPGDFFLFADAPCAVRVRFHCVRQLHQCHVGARLRERGHSGDEEERRLL